MEFYGGYQVYSESGIDLTLLTERLKMTITERWQANARALEVVEAFRNAKPAQCQTDLQSLVTGQVEFVVVGGLAMVTRGTSFITEDLDVCYRRSPENIVRLASAIAAVRTIPSRRPEGFPFTSMLQLSPQD